MRIAWASPVPPAASGIADYAAELLPHLSTLAEVVVYFDGVKAPEPAFAARHRCVPVARLADEAGGYDAVLLHVGNDLRYHGGIWDALQRIPGIVVLHEFVLHHLLRERTLARGDLGAYREELRYAVGETGTRLGEAAAAGRTVDAWRFPLFERVVDRASAVFVHSEFAKRRILASRPAARVEVVPMPADTDTLRPSTPAERRAARRSLGIAEDAFLVGSFGYVTAHKHLEPAIAAFAEARRRMPAATLAVVGAVAPGYVLPGTEGVRVTGRVPLDELHRWMGAVDVALSLRFPTAGETSAALLRLFALGTPTIVSNVGAFSELPPGSCFPVDVDGNETELLARLLLRLAEDEPLRAAAGREARRVAVEGHALPVVARRYVACVEASLARGDVPRQRTAPLSGWTTPDLPVELRARLGSAAADLGVAEDDELLEVIAERLVELGLDR